MRPTRTVAVAVLTTALALVALPGLTASHVPRAVSPIDAARLNGVSSPRTGSAARIDPLDPGGRSAGSIEPGEVIVDGGREVVALRSRPVVEQPASQSASVARPPRYTLRGIATFYDHGTTAMRLPRGTLVVICGAGGCIERRITDYGPNSAIHPERIADLYRPDFFAVCGCPWYAGTTKVTVSVY